MNKTVLKETLRQWLPLVLTALLLGSFVLLDEAVKSSAPIDGYCPKDTLWIAAAENGPAFWDHLTGTDSFGRVKEDWPQPLSNIELAVRKTTGVRPTAARWRVFLGRKMLAAGLREDESGESATGLCVYPGVVLRSLDWVARLFSRPSDTGIYQFGGLKYAWRDGFLIVSESLEYVEQSLKAPPPGVAQSAGPDRLRIHLTGDQPGLLELRARDGLPVTGWMHVTVTPRERPLTLANAWPETPLLLVDATAWSDVYALFTVFNRHFDQLDSWRETTLAAQELWRFWTKPEQRSNLPEDAGAPQSPEIDEVCLALVEVDLSEELPIPKMAAIMRAQSPVSGPHPLAGTFSELDAFSMEWHGEPGLLIPLLGDKVTPCLSQNGNDYLAASQEPLMNELVDGVVPGPAVEGDIHVTLHWGEAGNVLEWCLNKLAGDELFTRQDELDLSMHWLPMARGISRLGMCRLTGQTRQGRFLLEGHLAAEVPETTSAP